METLGLPHDEGGPAVTRLPVTIKVAIGEKIAQENGNAHPSRLDHFVFKRRSQNGQEVSWVPAQDITSLFEHNPRAIALVFTSNDIDDVLQTQCPYCTADGYHRYARLIQTQHPTGLQSLM